MPPVAGRTPRTVPSGNVTYETERQTASQRGYTYKWQRARLQFLSSSPLCAHCLAQGKTTPANTVDHVTPHRGDSVLFWDVSNWQALCKGCHDVKTAAGL